MKEENILIPATAQATAAYRLEQSARQMAEEAAQPMTWGRHLSKIFKRGRHLDPTHCLHTKPIDGWAPIASTPLSDLLPSQVAVRLDREWQRDGLAGVIALTDTVAGVRELIEYDENEQIIKPMMEKSHDK